MASGQTPDQPQITPLVPFRKKPTIKEDDLLAGRIAASGPLPAGQIVLKSPTPYEQSQYELIGLSAGDTVPENLAELAEHARVSAIEFATAARGVGTINPEVKDIRELPPEAQAHYAQVMRESIKLYKEMEARARKQDDGLQKGGLYAPGVADAVRRANVPQATQTPLQAPPQAPPQAPSKPVSDGVVYPENWPQPQPRPQPQVQAQPQPRPQPQVQQPEEPPVTKEPPTEQDAMTLANGGHPTHCPYCNADLRKPPIWEKPSDQDRYRFEIALLGQQQFRKTFLVHDGQIEIEFRELSPAEVDMCQRQCFLDQEANDIKSADDYFERISRYRTYLQLSKLVMNGRVIPLPQSPDEWRQLVDEETLNGQTLLPQISEIITNQVLKTSTLHRIVGRCRAAFDMLCGQLEASFADFSKGTD